MRLRLPAVALAASALLTGVMVATPAEAATSYVYVSTPSIGFNSSGETMAYAKCGSSKTCKGSVYVNGDTRKSSFSIPARSGKYILLRVTKGGKYDPYVNGSDKTEIKRIANVKIRVAETSPKKITHDYVRSLDTRLPGSMQQLRGTITGAPGSKAVSNVKVRLIEKKRGGVERLVVTRPVTMTQQGDGSWKGDYAPINIRVDGNNTAVTKYYLKLEGNDPQGNPRSWWWRGGDGAYLGGPRYSLDASSVTVGRYHDFVADFSYSHLSGRILAPREFGAATSSYVKSGVDVSVAAPPPRSYGSNSRAFQELDISRCANVFARTKTDSSGRYRVDFLPTGSASKNENKYMVGARSGSAEVWTGKNDPSASRRYGSCYDATGYNYSKDNLIDLTAQTTADLPLTTPTQTAKVNKPSLRYSRTVGNDRWITIREKIPGLAVLDSPVVAQGSATSGRSFKLAQGKYWLEAGRRTGCSTWLRSKYPDNRAYFNGADRGAERWKTVSGKYAEYKKSYSMGYKAKSPGKGYKGWMYRGYCKTLSAGSIKTFSVGTSNPTVTPTAASRGAVVAGKVTRTGGRTNKEMMVRLSNSGGTKVIRTDLSDSGGKFFVAGLAPGKYTISVNSDSWRGISRSFSGKHSITVNANRTYKIGTLRFKG